jgi:16S rRNA processing protein RimM
MNKDLCFYIGYFGKAANTTGDILLHLDVDDPYRYKKLESIFVQLHERNKELVPFFVTNISIQPKGKARLLLSGITTAADVKMLSGKAVFLPLSELPPLSGKQFYFHEVIGFAVVDVEEGLIGKVTQVLEYPTSAVLEISHPNEKEILVPINDQTILDIFRDKKELHVRAPEGLVALYLNP